MLPSFFDSVLQLIVRTSTDLTVKDFPAIVTMDAHGNSLHKDIEQDSGEHDSACCDPRPVPSPLTRLGLALQRLSA